MRRFTVMSSGLAILLLALSSFHLLSVQKASAQTASRDVDARLDQTLREIQNLRALVASQATRITNLEKSVRSLEEHLRTPAGNRWRTAEGWAAVRIGMSRAEVEYILGPPRTVESVIDRQTLTYGTATNIVGTVILVDDRVSQVDAPGFKIVLPEPGR